MNPPDGSSKIDALVDRIDRLIAVMCGDRNPGTPIHVDQMLSVEQVAEILCVHGNTVRRYINRENRPLPARWVPGTRTVRVRWGDLSEWLEPAGVDQFVRP